MTQQHVNNDRQGTRKPRGERQDTTAERQATTPEWQTLQQSIGNQAVGHLVEKERMQRAQRQAFTEPPTPINDETQREIDALRGGGHEMEPATRAEMEPNLGADLSKVRIHEGPAVDQTAHQLHARAFTQASDVFIGERGRDHATLAHELTHAAQGRTAPGSVQRASDDDTDWWGTDEDEMKSPAPTPAAPASAGGDAAIQSIIGGASGGASTVNQDTSPQVLAPPPTAGDATDQSTGAPQPDKPSTEPATVKTSDPAKGGPVGAPGTADAPTRTDIDPAILKAAEEAAAPIKEDDEAEEPQPQVSMALPGKDGKVKYVNKPKKVAPAPHLDPRTEAIIENKKVRNDIGDMVDPLGPINRQERAERAWDEAKSDEQARQQMKAKMDARIQALRDSGKLPKKGNSKGLREGAAIDMIGGSTDQAFVRSTPSSGGAPEPSDFPSLKLDKPDKPEEKQEPAPFVPQKFSFALTIDNVTKEYSGLTAEQAIAELKWRWISVRGYIDVYKEWHRDILDNRSDHPVVGFVVDHLGHRDPPDIRIWDSLESDLGDAMKPIDLDVPQLRSEFEEQERKREEYEKRRDDERAAQGLARLLPFRGLNPKWGTQADWEAYMERHIRSAVQSLQSAAFRIESRRKSVFYYKEKTIETTADAITALKVAKRAGQIAASFLPVGQGLTLLQGAIVTAGVTTAYNAGQEFLGQTSEMAFGERTEFDFSRIAKNAAKDAAVGFVGGLAGGYLAKTFGGALARRFGDSLSKQTLERLQTWLIAPGTGALVSPLTTTTRVVIERAVGDRKKITAGDLVSEIVNGLPEDALMGFVGAGIHQNIDAGSPWYEQPTEPNIAAPSPVSESVPVAEAPAGRPTAEMPAQAGVGEAPAMPGTEAPAGQPTLDMPAQGSAGEPSTPAAPSEVPITERATQVQPAATETAQRTTDVQPAGQRPTERQPVAQRPTVTESAARTTEVQPAGQRPTERQPVAQRPTVTESATRTTEVQPAGQRPTERQPVAQRPTVTESAARTTEVQPAGQRPTEQQPVSQRPTERRPAVEAPTGAMSAQTPIGEAPALPQSAAEAPTGAMPAQTPAGETPVGGGPPPMPEPTGRAEEAGGPAMEPRGPAAPVGEASYESPFRDPVEASQVLADHVLLRGEVRLMDHVTARDAWVREYGGELQPGQESPVAWYEVGGKKMVVDASRVRMPLLETEIHQGPIQRDAGIVAGEGQGVVEAPGAPGPEGQPGGNATVDSFGPGNALLPLDALDSTNNPVEAARALKTAISADLQYRIMGTPETPMTAQEAWNVSFGRPGKAPLAWRDLYGNVYIDGKRVQAADLLAPGMGEGPPNFEIVPDLEPSDTAAPAAPSARPGPVPRDNIPFASDAPQPAGGGAARRGPAGGEGRGSNRAAGAFLGIDAIDATNNHIEVARAYREVIAEGSHYRVMGTPETPMTAKEAWNGSFGRQGEPPLAWRDRYGNLYIDGHRVKPSDLQAPGLGEGPANFEPLPDLEPAEANELGGESGGTPAGAGDGGGGRQTVYSEAPGPQTQGTEPPRAAGGSDGGARSSGRPQQSDPRRVVDRIDDANRAAELYHHYDRLHARDEADNPPGFTIDRDVYEANWGLAGGTGEAPPAWIDQYGGMNVDASRVDVHTPPSTSGGSGGGSRGAARAVDDDDVVIIEDDDEAAMRDDVEETVEEDDDAAIGDETETEEVVPDNAVDPYGVTGQLGTEAGPQRVWGPPTREVQRSITDPMEAARLFVEQIRGGNRNARAIRNLGVLRTTWRYTYRQQTDPPVAWLDTNGNIVIDGLRVDPRRAPNYRPVNDEEE
jgi:Domain of unknown function (DUF4157)